MNVKENLINFKRRSSRYSLKTKKKKILRKDESFQAPKQWKQSDLCEQQIDNVAWKTLTNIEHSPMNSQTILTISCS